MNISRDCWDYIKLGSICERVKTIDIRKQKGSFNYIDIGSIDSSSKRVAVLQQLDWVNASSRARQIIAKGDTLFSTVRVNLERIAYLDKAVNNGIASTGFTVIRGSNSIEPMFLFYSIITPSFIEKLVNLQKGTAYPAVTDKIVFDQEIPLPPLDEQKQIVALFQSIETAIEQVDEQEKYLSQLKHKILVDLFCDKKQFGSYIQPNEFETIRFEKIAFNISERVEPQKTELTIYVGLEHLKADNLNIEETGSPNDVIGTKLKIYKGDIIFGKRRAYLRKVAVSHFDGIASAHSMILRANENNIEKDFLPHFMQSDAFMNRAVQISEGSLSPTIKWKTLAAQEFYLPKKEKQKKLVELFKQFDKTRDLLKTQKASLRKLKQQLLNEILG